MMVNENTNSMEEKMNNLEVEVRDLKDKVKIKNNKNIRLKSDSNGKCNILKRISISLSNEGEKINNERQERGFNKLSMPKITHLMVTHKVHWLPIREDIINYKNEK